MAGPGRPRKPIPDDADPVVAQFVTELRDMVYETVKDKPVSVLADYGPVSRSTLMHALSGQRLPTLSTVKGVVDSIAKYRALSTYAHRMLLGEWAVKQNEAVRLLGGDKHVALADLAAASSELAFATDRPERERESLRASAEHHLGELRRGLAEIEAREATQQPSAIFAATGSGKTEVMMQLAGSAARAAYLSEHAALLKAAREREKAAAAAWMDDSDVLAASAAFDRALQRLEVASREVTEASVALQQAVEREKSRTVHDLVPNQIVHTLLKDGRSDVNRIAVRTGINALTVFRCLMTNLIDGGFVKAEDDPERRTVVFALTEYGRTAVEAGQFAAHDDAVQGN
ncbi:hypothetical protein [Streptomyces sp. NPDC057428]|uniref:hypothetical protein n=1 Tax=Streptomyces sp. NPDC057428 TaxID=3346129 RepID=UPI0036903F69